MNSSELAEALTLIDRESPRPTDREILEHFSENNETILMDGREVFIMSDARKFGDTKHIVSFHGSDYATVPEHIYQYVLITYCRSGEFRMFVNNEPVKLHAGDCLVADRHVPHGVLPTSADTFAVNIVLSDRFFFRRMRSDISRLHSSFATSLASTGSVHTDYRVYRGGGDEFVKMCIERILCEKLDPKTGSDDIIDDFVAALLTHLVRAHEPDIEASEQQSKRSDLIGIIRAYVEKNYRSGNLAVMAKELGYDSTYLSTTIRHSTGITFKQLVNEERMRRALILLQSGNDPIYEIAAHVGVSNLTQFYKRFHEYAGCTPQEYRKKTR